MKTAPTIAEFLERARPWEDVEVEFVFSYGELKDAISALEVTATRKDGEPREPFTVNLQATKPYPWTRLVGRQILRI